MKTLGCPSIVGSRFSGIATKSRTTVSWQKIPLWLAAALALCCLSSLHAETFCIDYQYHPKSESLRLYDFTILSPYAQADLAPGHAMGKEFYAYISAGEIARNAQYLAAAEAARIPFATENPNWDSLVVDQTSPLWAPFVINQLARPAAQQGYDGFFLDTMDSYYLLAPWQTWAPQEIGLVNMVRQLKAAFPNKKIIINRGFPLFERLKNVVDGMLIEGLFYSYPGAQNEQNDTTWLVEQLAQVKAAGRAVYVVDYVGNTPAIAQQIANQISDLGFSPLIVARSLDGTVLATEKLAPAASPTPPPTPVIPALKRVTVLTRVTRLPVRNGYPTWRFQGRPGITYAFEWASTRSGPWTLIEELPAETKSRLMEVQDLTVARGEPDRFYRLLKVYYR